MGWEGQRVAVIADLQIGMWLGNPGTAERMVRRLIDERPAIALVAGDLVYGESRSAQRIAKVVDILRLIPQAGIPTYAVLGNHDYSADSAAPLHDRLEESGVDVLDNDVVAVPSRGGAEQGAPLYVAGVGAHRPGEDRPAATLEQVPRDAARIVFMHNPASFDELAPGTSPLAVAGHTHGGQVRLPFLELEPAGWQAEEAGNRLYINRGIGMSLLPVRFNCPPELTLFTLRRM